MNFKLAVSALAVASAFAMLPGCAADVPVDEADAEEAETSEDELGANQRRFVGAYHGTGPFCDPDLPNGVARRKFLLFREQTWSAQLLSANRAMLGRGQTV